MGPTRSIAGRATRMGARGSMIQMGGMGGVPMGIIGGVFAIAYVRVRRIRARIVDARVGTGFVLLGIIGGVSVCKLTELLDTGLERFGCHLGTHLLWISRTSYSAFQLPQAELQK